MRVQQWRTLACTYTYARGCPNRTVVLYTLGADFKTKPPRAGAAGSTRRGPAEGQGRELLLTNKHVNQSLKF